MEQVHTTWGSVGTHATWATLPPHSAQHDTWDMASPWHTDMGWWDTSTTPSPQHRDLMPLRGHTSHSPPLVPPAVAGTGRGKRHPKPSTHLPAAPHHTSTQTSTGWPSWDWDGPPGLHMPPTAKIAGVGQPSTPSTCRSLVGRYLLRWIEQQVYTPPPGISSDASSPSANLLKPSLLPTGRGGLQPGSAELPPPSDARLPGRGAAPAGPMAGLQGYLFSGWEGPSVVDQIAGITLVKTGARHPSQTRAPPGSRQAILPPSPTNTPTSEGSGGTTCRLLTTSRRQDGRTKFFPALPADFSV